MGRSQQKDSRREIMPVTMYRTNNVLPFAVILAIVLQKIYVLHDGFRNTETDGHCHEASL